MPPSDPFISRYGLTMESPISQSEEPDLSGSDDVEFEVLPRAVWIEVASASILVFRLAGDTRFQARTISSNGWYPWRIAAIRPNGSSQSVKTASGVRVIGDY